MTSPEPTSPTKASATGLHRPAWHSAFIVMPVLFAFSEILYLALGGIAKACLTGNPVAASCGAMATDVSNALFAEAVDVSGISVFSNIFAVGLPGFNNLFYLFISGLGIDTIDQLLATVAASIVIGYMVVWGYLAMSVSRGVFIRLLLAVAFAAGWWVLYNNTEASIYKSDFRALAPSRYLEVPIAAASLFVASFFARSGKT